MILHLSKVLPAGKETLYFFPDMLLVEAKGRYGAVTYRDLNSETSQENFIETQGVPSDAKVVDHTWHYVNKKGGPDRRFANNPEYPVCLYEALHLTSRSGLNEQFRVSRLGMGAGFIQAVQALAAYAG